MKGGLVHMKHTRLTSRKARNRGVSTSAHRTDSVTARDYDSFELGLVRGATRALFALKAKGVVLKLDNLAERHPGLAEKLR